MEIHPLQSVIRLSSIEKKTQKILPPLGVAGVKFLEILYTFSSKHSSRKLTTNKFSCIEGTNKKD